MLTEKEIRDIVNSEVDKHLQHPSKLIGKDEMFGYSSISPNDSGLNCYIFLDDSCSYMKYKHPLYVIFNNGSGKSDELIPITIEPKINIVNTNFKIKLNQVDLKKIYKFIETNKNLIFKLANEEIDIFDFTELMVTQENRYSLAESLNKSLLVEMSKLLPKRTGLPVPVWVQETKMDMQHGLRMKFQASPVQINTDNYSSISLETFEFFNLPTKNCITNRDLRKIKRFVELNQKILIELALAKIDLNIFLASLIKS